MEDLVLVGTHVRLEPLERCHADGLVAAARLAVLQAAPLIVYTASGGARMHPNYIRVGGLGQDLPHGFLDKLDAVIAMYEPRMRDVRRLLQKNPILQDRMIDVGILESE